MMREMLGEERAGGETPHLARHRLLQCRRRLQMSERRLAAQPRRQALFWGQAGGARTCTDMDGQSLRF